MTVMRQMPPMPTIDDSYYHASDNSTLSFSPKQQGASADTASHYAPMARTSLFGRFLDHRQARWKGDAVHFMHMIL